MNDLCAGDVHVCACASGCLMRGRNQQGKRVYTSTLSPVNTLVFYGQLHNECTKDSSDAKSSRAAPRFTTKSKKKENRVFVVWHCWIRTPVIASFPSPHCEASEEGKWNMP